MTDRTTYAPERIWATEDVENFGEDAFHSLKPFRGGTEYVRADLLTAAESQRDDALAQVAALREALRLTAITAAQLGATDMELEEANAVLTSTAPFAAAHDRKVMRGGMERAVKIIADEADRVDDAIVWGGARKYIERCKSASYAMRDREAAIRAEIAKLDEDGE